MSDVLPSPPDEPRHPFTLRCGACEHRWVAIYTPMEMSLFARLLRRVFCPMCGETKKIFLPMNKERRNGR